ncbi:MAG: GNAT family acetyltransferase [Gemmatimonadetes bacterium]|nr:GNAT family acetyltransferase [Gemmatimonadota bacterium]
MDILPFREADREEVIRLWERCGLVAPQNDPSEDIDMKLAFQPDLFLIGVAGGRVVASAMAGYEGHRGWVNYVGVAPEYRRKGYGRAMMEEAERRLVALGCVKVNLQVRAGNSEVAAFYEAAGYSVEERVSMGKRLRGRGGRT